MPPRDVVERDKGSGGARDLGSRGNTGRESRGGATPRNNNPIPSKSSTPNPEMGGSPQRVSQQNMIASSTFDRFMRDLKDENTILDTAADIFSPIDTKPAIDQTTGMFGVQTSLRPTRLGGAGLSITSNLLGIDPLIDLGFSPSIGSSSNRRSSLGGRDKDDNRVIDSVTNAVTDSVADQTGEDPTAVSDAIQEFLNANPLFTPFEFPEFELLEPTFGSTDPTTETPVQDTVIQTNRANENQAVTRKNTTNRQRLRAMPSFKNLARTGVK